MRRWQRSLAVAPGTCTHPSSEIALIRKRPRPHGRTVRWTGGAQRHTAAVYVPCWAATSPSPASTHTCRLAATVCAHSRGDRRPRAVPMACSPRRAQCHTHSQIGPAPAHGVAQTQAGRAAVAVSASADGKGATCSSATRGMEAELVLERPVWSWLRDHGVIGQAGAVEEVRPAPRAAAVAAQRSPPRCLSRDPTCASRARTPALF